MSFSEWKKYRLGDFAQIIMGQSPTGDTCNEIGEGIPLLNGPTEFTGHAPIPVQFTINAKKVSQIGDLLFCVRGSTTGRMNWSDKEYAIGRGLASIRHKKGKELQPFLRGLIEYNLNNILSQATGSTFPNVSSQQLSNLEVSIPEAKTQQRIASILVSLDDKIELNRQTNQTLEAMAQTLFKEMCLPKVEGLQDGCTVESLEDLVETVSVTHKMKQENVIFLNTSDILEGRVLNNDYCVVSSLPGQAKKSIKRNDILFSEIRPINKRYAFVNFDADDYVVSTKLMVLRSKGLVSPYLIYCFLSNSDTLRELQHLAETRSGTFPQITFTQLKNFKILIPDDKTLKRVTKNITDIFENMFLINKESQTLINLRNSLLPRLMKGEINFLKS